MCLQNSNNFKLTSKLKVIFCNLLNYTQRLDVTKTSSLLLFVNQKDAIEMESELYIKGSAAVKNRLEDIRRERGIRQEELASELEVSRQTISSLENGRYNPSIVLAFKIARYFNMSIEEIFVYEED